MLYRGSDTKQAERAGVRDASPQGRDTPWRGSIHGSLTPQAARYQRQQEVTQMPDDELRELEAKRRKALWMLANISPGDSKAFDALSILDYLDLQERKDSPHADKALELNKLRDCVKVQHHHSGIDIIREQSIPQPWRERFNQASIGSTKLLDGPYAADWYKFLACWETEMQHLEAHRAACSNPKLD
ncbi:MAG: DNA helicase UvrD [Pseudomonas sp. PGPPP2]|nr:MAG: DNA helicase UvrD [Pseudomonas sp. PGPPP2]